MQQYQGLIYDKVSWYLDGDFPAELSRDAARTHIGMFLAWAIDRGLASDELVVARDELARSIGRTPAPSMVLEYCCDDALTNEFLDDTGNAFASDYYERRYLDDYVDLSDDGLPTIYHEPDSEETHAKVRTVLDRRLAEWRSQSAR